MWNEFFPRGGRTGSFCADEGARVSEANIDGIYHLRNPRNTAASIRVNAVALLRAPGAATKSPRRR